MEFIKCLEENGLTNKQLPSDINELIIKYNQRVKSKATLRELTKLDEELCDKIEAFSEELDNDRHGISANEKEDNEDILEKLIRLNKKEISKSELIKLGFTMPSSMPKKGLIFGDYQLKKKNQFSSNFIISQK